jgi:hypothetical protein
VVWWSAADRRHAVHDGVEMYVEIYLGVQTMAPRWANAMQLNREQRCPRVAQQAQAQAQAQRGVLCSALLTRRAVARDLSSLTFPHGDGEPLHRAGRHRGHKKKSRY